VTFLGDVFHPMTFFRADGGNNAIQDALELGRVLRDDRHLESGCAAAD
jgi:2-polyprenyl-6-methoxyphenol hydroxylase-like FAD-dependent oxidoreductase